jgi:hypothetical protein
VTSLYVYSLFMFASGWTFVWSNICAYFPWSMKASVLAKIFWKNLIQRLFYQVNVSSIFLSLALSFSLLKASISKEKQIWRFLSSLQNFRSPSHLQITNWMTSSNPELYSHHQSDFWLPLLCEFPNFWIFKFLINSLNFFSINSVCTRITWCWSYVRKQYPWCFYF